MIELGRVNGEDIWERLGRYWLHLESGLDPSGLANKQQSMSEDTRLDLATMMAKLERNLIAGLLIHQQKAMYACLATLAVV